MFKLEMMKGSLVKAARKMALQFTLIVFIINSFLTSVNPGEVVKPSAPFPVWILVANYFSFIIMQCL